MADLIEYLHNELDIRIEQPRQEGRGEKQRCIWYCEEYGRSRRCMRADKPRIDYDALSDAVEKINRRSDRFRVQGSYPSRDDFSKIVKPMKYIVDAFSCGLHKKNEKEYRAKHLAMDFFVFGKLEMQQESQVKKRKTNEVEGDTVASSSSTSLASIPPRPTKRARQTSKSSNQSSDMAAQTIASSPPSTPSSYGAPKETNPQTINTGDNNMPPYRVAATNVDLNHQFQDNAGNHDQETAYSDAEGIALFCRSCDGDRNNGHAADCEFIVAASIAPEPAEPTHWSLCDGCALRFGNDFDIEWSGTCLWCGMVDEMIPIAGVPADHSASAGDNMTETESGPVATSQDVVKALES